MEAYDPQDELERVKTWWKTYGGAVLTGVIIGLVLLVGINAWRSYKSEQATAASQLYDQMMRAVEQKNLEQARAAGNTLQQKYESTPYAGKAALFQAKLEYEAGEAASARKQLEWAMERAREEVVRHTARLRLARLLLSANEVEGAAKLLDVKETGGLDSEYQDAHGDVFAAQGKTAEARKAYQAARDALPEGSPYARVIEMKIDDLGPEKQG